MGLQTFCVRQILRQRDHIFKAFLQVGIQVPILTDFCYVQARCFENATFYGDWQGCDVQCESCFAQQLALQSETRGVRAQVGLARNFGQELSALLFAYVRPVADQFSAADRLDLTRRLVKLFLDEGEFPVVLVVADVQRVVLDHRFDVVADCERREKTLHRDIVSDIRVTLQVVDR